MSLRIECPGNSGEYGTIYGRRYYTMLKPQLLQAESIYMAQSEPEVELPPKQEVVICILKWGAVYQYTIPGFSVITVQQSLAALFSLLQLPIASVLDLVQS